MARIYLDNAATTWPKPETVYVAVDRYQRENGAPAGRGAYGEALAVAKEIAAARSGVARLIGAGKPMQVVFGYSGTDVLNAALYGLLRAGDHVVTSVAEHNSVLRPLREMESAGRIAVTRVGCDAQGVVDPKEFARALRPETRLAALVHASNVTGALQPIAEVGEFVRKHGAFFLVDAAQSLGHVPIDVSALPIDLLAAPGHKGLLGPLGTGVLYLRAGMEEHLVSFRQGGTGSRSEEDRQPAMLPDKYEAGNLNVPGLAGLNAGMQHVLHSTVTALRRREAALTERLLQGLREIAGVELFGPNDSQLQLGVVSLRISGYDPQEAAALLDMQFGVQTRAGLHCAPRMHRSLGTLEKGGTLRLSLGPFNTDSDIQQALAAIASLSQVV